VELLERGFREAQARGDPALAQLIDRREHGEATTLQTVQALLRCLLEG
jgi:hypothetical protein